MISKTKIVGWLIFITSIVNIVIDALNGGGFNISSHLDSMLAAANGMGLVFLRDGIKKVQDAVTKK